MLKTKLDMKKIIGIITFLIFTGCSGDQSRENIYSLLVSKKNELVKEDYFNGKGKTDLVNVQSVTKSIVSLLIGVAIEKGYIKNEENYLFEYFPEEPSLQIGEKKKITVKHLLNHTSGLEWNGYVEHDDFLKSNNPLKLVIDREMVATPGELYNYNSGGTHLLSIILSKTTGKSTLDFADEHLFKPLGIEKVNWEKLNDGYYDGAGFGLSMISLDLLKIGQLVIDNGKHENSQIIPMEWIEKSFSENLKSKTKWGLRKSKHGYGWYTKTYDDKQILYSMGYGGQFIFILPSDELILITTHNHDTPNGINQQIDFLKSTFPSLINEYGS